MKKLEKLEKKRKKKQRTPIPEGDVEDLLHHDEESAEETKGPAEIDPPQEDDADRRHWDLLL